MQQHLKKLFGLAVIFIMVNCFLAGFTFVEKIEYKLDESDFDHYSLDLSQTLSNNEKNQFKNFYSDASFKVLYNLNDEPEYILVTLGNNGYGIFNRLTGKLLEGTLENESPYKNVDKGYYIAQMSYAKGNPEQLFDINTNQAYEINEINEFKRMQKNLTIKNIVEVNNNLNDFSKKTALKSIDLSPEFNLNEIEYELSALDAQQYSNVENDDAIMSWYSENTDYLENSQGTCTQVAMTLLYRYADAVYGGIIPAEPPTEWISLCDDYTITSEDMDSLDISMVQNDPIYVNFTRYLIGLSGITEGGTNEVEKLRMLNAYNSEINSLGCLNLSVDSRIQNNADVLGNFVSDGIYNNKPTVLSIFSSKGTEIGRHSVLAYGKHGSSTNLKYRIHTGWQNKSSYFISSDYVNYSDGKTAIQLNVTTNTQHQISSGEGTHNCSNNLCYANNVEHRFLGLEDVHECVCGATGSHSFTIDGKSMYSGVHKCTYCGYTENHSYDRYNVLQHHCEICNRNELHDLLYANGAHLCVNLCGYSDYCTSSSWSSVDMFQHKGTCNVCLENAYRNHSGFVSLGSSGHSIDCEECGLVVASTPHTLSYQKQTSSQHALVCKYCGYIGTRSNHTFELYLGFFRKCKICGYVTLRQL